MAKKKKKTKDREPIDVGAWSKPQYGTPTIVMFPARNYHFKVSKTEYSITIPRKGNYHEMAPEVFDLEAGDFMFFDEENSIIYLPALTKILFAADKYPAMKSNQLFAPIALIIKEETVDIIGHIVEMLPPLSVNSTAK